MVALSCCGRPPNKTETPTRVNHTASSVSPQVTSTPPSEPIRVVGLGDSVTAGYACGCTTFVTLYSQALAKRWHVATQGTNLGQSGLTSTRLLTQLESNQAQQTQVQAADVLLITVGANDLLPALTQWDGAPGKDPSACGGTCRSDDLDAVGNTIRQIITRIHLLRQGRPTLVLVTTYWNVFEDGDTAATDRGSAFMQWSNGLTRRLNQRIIQAAQRSHATPVDLYTPFKHDGQDPTTLLADDGDHPNAAGHQLIADAALAATPASVDTLSVR